MENLYDENYHPNRIIKVSSSSPKKLSPKKLSPKTSSSSLSPRTSSSSLSPRTSLSPSSSSSLRSSLSTLILTPPDYVSPIKRVSEYDPYQSPCITRLDEYLQAKEELFIDRARSPKKTPTKTDSSSQTPTKTGKTVRIDISENKYRLFEKDSATSSHYHNDHSLSFNYSASKSAESLYRQPILKSNRSSLLPTLSSSSSSSSSPKKKQIRLPEQYFKQEESLSRLSRNVHHSITNSTNNSTSNSTNNDTTIDDDNDVDNDIDIDYDYDYDSSSSRIWVILIVVVSLLLYAFANSDNNNTSNTNDTWYSQVKQASYAVDIYHDTNDKYIIDTSTIMTINTNTIMTIIDEYVRQPVYQYINLVFDDNSKALVLVPTSSSSITLSTSAIDYRHVTTTLATQAYSVINDYVPSDITNYNSLYIHQMNIVTMLTSAAIATHFYFSRH